MKNVVEIINVFARQILDSRCFPTVEVEVILEDGTGSEIDGISK